MFWNIMVGLWRRITFGGQGVRPRSELGKRLGDQANLFRENRSMLLALVRDYSSMPEPLSTLVQVQTENEEWEEALTTAATLRAGFPDLIAGYYAACTVFRRLQRFDEAEQVARAAVWRFPRNSTAFVSYASVALERGDNALAARRWALTARRFPGVLWPQLMNARMIAMTGDVSGADALLQRIVMQWPEDVQAWQAFVQNAEQAKDWEAAAVRWGAMRARFPGRVDVYRRGARALRLAGQLAAAELVVSEGSFMFPGNSDIVAEQTAITQARLGS